MCSNLFKFKQFAICQDKSAMKVGTDGVLLGAWVKLNEPMQILDIGSGTGLISLMLAQRESEAYIEAVELQDASFEEAVFNFEQSNWSDRLFCYHCSIQEFVEEVEDQYDLIISNPPFFEVSDSTTSSPKKIARQHTTLSFETLLESSAALLSANGSCAFVIPFDFEEEFIKLASSFDLHLSRRMRVKGTPDVPVKRSLLQFSFKRAEIEESELIIEYSRHQYTEAYKALTKDFYLAM